MSRYPRIPKLKVPESSVIKAVAEYLGVLENLGKIVWWTRVSTGLMRIPGQKKGAWAGAERFMKLARTGTPDFVGCLPGGFLLAIECKSSSGKTTLEQGITLTKIERAGGTICIARGAEDVQSALGESK